MPVWIYAMMILGGCLRALVADSRLLPMLKMKATRVLGATKQTM